MRKTNRIISMIMIFLILLNSSVSVFAAEPHIAPVHIKTAEDMLKFSEDASFDKWSKDRTVVLDNNISLEDVDFFPIPIFGGVFDGGGHTISGLKVDVEGSNQGLFRYLQEGATIKNLSVRGVVTPMGEKSNIGGIVGNNEGLIENCSFVGFVKGKDTVGGIAGWNGSKGMIVKSSFNGVIYGKSKVGGVVGYNAGTTLRCTNDSNVNTTVEEEKVDISDITLDNVNLTQLVEDAIDIGGIAGINTGVVQNSENFGKLGYPHVGYNVGGIVGRQSGYITNCTNHGSIYGRKEVGGIVGQIEPHISTIIGESKLKDLKKELNGLDSSITNMINDAKGFSGNITKNLEAIQDNIDNSKAHAQSLIDQTGSMIDDDIEELGKIGVIGAEALDKLMPITEIFEDTIETMGEAIKLMEKALGYINGIMNESTFLSEKFKDVSKSLEGSIFRLIEIQEKLRAARLDIIQATKLLKEFKIPEACELLNSAFTSMKEVRWSLKKAIITFDPRATFEKLFDEIEGLMESTDYVGGSMDSALILMTEAIGLMDEVIGDFGGVFDIFEDLLKFIAEQEGLEFEFTNDLYEKTKEDLFGSINDVTGNLSNFIEDMTSSGDKLIDDMQVISDKLFGLMNLMINIIEEISNDSISTDDIIKDVSRDDIEKKTEGKVADSYNFGIIDGDLNVGGIAGGMSIELKTDPELDLNLQGKLSYNTVFETRAIISRCKNEGSIIGKKNGVGGIVGNMELGYLNDCAVYSSVESTDGNDVGGIAGKSDAPIVSCFARGTLDGGNNIGGIAGIGKEIVESYSLVEIDRSQACVGAIAGDIDKDSKIKDNYFVSDTLRGIDGISYMDKAEPISYEKLVAVEGIPNIFKDFKLNFWVDDEIVDTVSFKYGDSIAIEDFPDIPVKEKYYSKWEDVDTKNVTFDADIHAEYFLYLTILESKEKRDDILPRLLVEGSFTEKDELILTEYEGEGPLIEEAIEALEKWDVVIPDDADTTHIIRYLPPEDKMNLDVYILKEAKWEKVKSHMDGKYLVFEADGKDIVFSVVDIGASNIKYMIIIGVGLLLALILILIVVRRGRTRKKSLNELLEKSKKTEGENK
ncbi:MAG TPA: hypothetical protein VFC79_07340 [Tissierellaceae bacterium]|nr:hypothetical protein [Tissierellaceae bacterium]